MLSHAAATLPDRRARAVHVGEDARFHHGKHHQAYVDTLNKLVEGTPEADKSLEELIVATHHDDTKTLVFNNAAQVWNHTFFWGA